MPIYEYECTKCKGVLEAFQRLNEQPLTVCSVCGGSLKKVISTTAFVLKGDGWYVSDYPSKDRKSAIESEKKETQPALAAKSDTAGKSSGAEDSSKASEKATHT